MQNDTGNVADVVTQVYMPLRSNAAWFSNADTKARLESQLKTNLVLYDRVVLQDGRYHVTAGDDGQGMAWEFPGDNCGVDRTRVKYYEPGQFFGVAVEGKFVMSSTCQTAYEIDFLPMIQETRLEDVTYIRWISSDVRPEVKSAIESQVHTDLMTHSCDDVLPENSYLRKRVLEGLYRDAAVAHSLATPFSVDFNVAPLVEYQQRMARQRWSNEIPAAFFDYWVKMELPDLSTLDWWDLHEFRESAAGRSFREMVHRITRRVKNVIRESREQRDVDVWIAREFNQELLQELSKRITSPGMSIARSCLNVIPFGVIGSVVLEAMAMDADQNSWVSLVSSYKPRYSD